MRLEDVRLDRARGAWRLDMDEVYRTGREDLWSALTDRDRLHRWMADYRGDLRLGGTWQAWTGGALWGTGTVTACEPPSSFTTTWTAEDEQPTVLQVRLEEVEGGTRLRLTHDGIEDRYYVAGWAAYLAMLGDVLADPRREDLGEAGFSTRFAALRDAFDPIADRAAMP